MKRQIRLGVFETNSSSTHTLTICSKSDFEKWKRGELLLDEYSDEFIDTQKVSEKDLESYYDSIKKPYYKNYKDLDDDERKSIKNEYMENEVSGITYDYWKDDDYLDTYSKVYKTENGDEVVAFGKYGYSG